MFRNTCFHQLARFGCPKSHIGAVLLQIKMGQNFVLITWVLVDDVMSVRYFYPCIVIVVCLRGMVFNMYKKTCPLGGINKDFVSIY